MPEYLFTLGREPTISLAELQAVLSSLGSPYRVLKTANEYATVEMAAPIDAAPLQNRLGGIIKIGQRLLSAGTTMETIKTHLTSAQPNKIEFSVHGGSKQIAARVKKELTAAGRSVRYIAPNNTATIAHNRLVERQGDVSVIGSDVFVTIAIQPINDWSERDFGRPSSDPKSGMLPPKLARMMINLSKAPPDATVLDPFCGSGTVLTEAMVIGFTTLVGADISKKAVADAEKNIKWIAEKLQINKQNVKLFVSDVRTIHRHLPPASIDAIVTEPFLGNPLRGHESSAFLKRQEQSLLDLYADALWAFHTILKPHAPVVMVIPAFRMSGGWRRLPIAPLAQRAGFETLPFAETEPALLYARPGQRVGREIWRLKKQ